MRCIITSGLIPERQRNSNRLELTNESARKQLIPSSFVILGSCRYLSMNCDQNWHNFLCALSMKYVHVHHNPGAGNEQHSKESIISAIEKFGYNVSYTSTEEPIEAIPPEVELLVVAGGDGTVRKVVDWMLNYEALAPHQAVTILPLGTANNIADTLDIRGDIDDIISAWREPTIAPFQIGEVTFDDQRNFFLEGVGFGLFPFHIVQMRARKAKSDLHSIPEKKESDLQHLLQNLKKVVPVHYDIQVDGKYISGEFIMVEVLNTRSIGPNIKLSPRGQPIDEWVELILVRESEKTLLSKYITNDFTKGSVPMGLTCLRGKEILIKCAFSVFHVDGELVELTPKDTVTIASAWKSLPFLLT